MRDAMGMLERNARACSPHALLLVLAAVDAVRLAGVVEPRMGAALRHHALAHHLCRGVVAERSCNTNGCQHGRPGLPILVAFPSQMQATAYIQGKPHQGHSASSWWGYCPVSHHCFPVHGLTYHRTAHCIGCARACYYVDVCQRKSSRRACATHAGMQTGLASDRSLCFAQVPLETSSTRLAVGTVPTWGRRWTRGAGRRS